MAEIINNELAQEFESLLLSTHREGIDKLIAYLKLKTDFFLRLQAQDFIPRAQAVYYSIL